MGRISDGDIRGALIEELAIRCASEYAAFLRTSGGTPSRCFAFDAICDTAPVLRVVYCRKNGETVDTAKITGQGIEDVLSRPASLITSARNRKADAIALCLSAPDAILVDMALKFAGMVPAGRQKVKIVDFVIAQDGKVWSLVRGVRD